MLRAAFFFAVAAFAWWRFSDNTADNDLWGHVLYGQRMLELGYLERVDPFSWTAPAAPWINHEVLAEITLGAVHRAAGGTGLWLLTLAAAGATLTLAWRTATASVREPGGAVLTASLLAVSTNGLALGFSARPQLFTMVALALWLIALRQLDAGRRGPLLALPLLTWVWINTHGGVLAGLLILGVATMATALSALFPFAAFFSRPVPGTWIRVAAAFLLCGVAALITPWGPESLRWLIASVSYTRPEITEWRATPFTPAFAPFWFVAVASALAWLVSRRERRAWEAATLALLLLMAVRHQRHVPLFCLANLMLSPPHLLDLAQRLGRSTAGLRAVLGRAGWRHLATLLLLAGGGAALAASVAAPRVHPATIEIERDQFPCAALRFLRAHPVDGNLLVFFDWGQQALWELPRNRVSFDGRLDTVYPREVIEAHWAFYAGRPFARDGLNLEQAEVALLPSASPGVRTLQAARWTTVYIDPLATILIRDASRVPPVALPVHAGPEAVSGREMFPALRPR